MPALLSLLFSRAGLVAIGGVALLILFGVQEGRIALARHGQRAAVEAQKVAQDGRKTCETSLGSLKTSVALLGQRSAAALAQAQKEAHAAQAQAQHYAQAAAALKAPKPGPDLQRWQDADVQVRGALK
jgi:lipase chaperone LimK